MERSRIVSTEENENDYGEVFEVQNPMELPKDGENRERDDPTTSSKVTRTKHIPDTKYTDNCANGGVDSMDNDDENTELAAGNINEKYKNILVETEDEPNEEKAIHEGGNSIKITIASANLGNEEVDDLWQWFPGRPVHTDVIAVGMQESTYGVESERNRERVSSTAEIFNEIRVEEGVEAEKAEDEKQFRTPDEQDLEETNADEHKSKSLEVKERKKVVQWNVTGGQHLEEALLRHIGDDFVLLCSRQVWEMRLHVYVHKSLSEEAQEELAQGSENTGVLGVGGNKGGLAVKFKLRGTSIVFVSAHLVSLFDTQIYIVKLTIMKILLCAASARLHMKVLNIVLGVTRIFTRF